MKTATPISSLTNLASAFASHGISALYNGEQAVTLGYQHVGVIAYNNSESKYEIQKISYNASTFSDTVTEL